MQTAEKQPDRQNGTRQNKAHSSLMLHARELAEGGDTPNMTSRIIEKIKFLRTLTGKAYSLTELCRCLSRQHIGEYGEEEASAR